MEDADKTKPLVSIIIPVFNGDRYLDECLKSILQQTYEGHIEVSAYNDSSTDRTAELLEQFKREYTQREHGELSFVLCHGSGGPKGVGYAKNRAVEQSSGSLLCFQDADDIMMPKRVEMQVAHLQSRMGDIVGANFQRIPLNATARHTDWLNSLSDEQVMSQRFREVTIIMPTWMMSREAFNKVGGFDEGGRGVPEDMIFFYQHIEHGGEVSKVHEMLLMYRYHADSVSFNVQGESRSFGVPRNVIFGHRLRHIERCLLSKWEKFGIWGAGKLGKQFYAALSAETRKKVVHFADVDKKKIGTKYHHATLKESVPIVHFTDITKPFVTCVNLGLTGGEFEANLASLPNTVEGRDYYHFA